MSNHPSWTDQARVALLRIDRSAALGLAVVALIGVVAAGAFAFHGRPRTVTVTGDGSAAVAPAAPAGAVSPGAASPAAVSPGAPGAGSSPGTGGAPAPSGAASTAPVLVIDVVGRVRRPGLVRVPAGARVWDVVQAAGGFVRRSDSPTVNLARLVADGEQLVVGPPPKGLAVVPPPGGGAAASGPGASGASAAPVDLNTATSEELETLPGVGPVLAQRILDHRTTNGPFRSIDELRDVSGIGDKTFADLAPRVRV